MTTQLGSSGDDTPLGIATAPDFSKVFLAGGTTGALPGNTSLGGTDGFIIGIELAPTPSEQISLIIAELQTLAEDNPSTPLAKALAKNDRYIAGCSKQTCRNATHA